MMKGTILSLLVFYKEKEIADPPGFVIDVCDMWSAAGFEPLKLYKRTALVAEITRDTKTLLQEVLTFSEKDKPDDHKCLLLKSSLKHSRVEISFRFEHPALKRISDSNYLGWQVTASSIGIDISFDKIKADKDYDIDKLLQVFFQLISNRAVEDANVNIVSSLEFETGVHQQIFDIISTKDHCIRKKRLDWATFFTASEYQKIVQRFAETGNSLAVFCEENGLEILTANNFDGAIMKVKKPLEDSPDYFYSMLKRTREF